MKKFDKFILKAFIGPFFAVLAVVIFILMMDFLWLYIDELVGKGLGLWVILEFMMWGCVTIMPISLPLAALLSSVMTLGNMSESNELLSMKASGISVRRVMLPIMIASVFISIGAFFVGNNLVPKAYNEILTLRDDIAMTKDEIKIPSGTFYDGIDGYVLRVNDTDEESGMMYDVMVYDHSAHKGNITISLADSATIQMSKNKEYLTFTMYSGSNYQEDNDWTYRDTSMGLQRISFDRQEMVIPLANYTFEKSDSSRFGDQIKSMRLEQLKIEQDSLRRMTKESLDKNYASVLGSNFLLGKQLDTAFAEQLPTTLYANENFLVWDDVDAEIRAVNTAISKCNTMETGAMSIVQDSYEWYFFLRRADIEILKRFAQALACLILFFVGAPLGALIRKGGLGTSAIVSALFFVLYWVIDVIGNKLARDGNTSAFIGVFISSAVLLPIGIFLTSKAVHDSDLFNMDNIKNKWRKLVSKVVGIFHRTRIVYMGTPEFAVAPLDALLKNKYNVVGVVTVADKPSGRGLAVNESAVKKYAVEHNIPVLQPLKLKDPEFLEKLKAFKADLFVVVAFRMLPEEVWAMPKLGTFNLHAALLPQYRGAAPINWAVINGEKITGVTTFMLDKDIDTGAILLRQECRIEPTDNVGDVHDKLMAIGSGLVVETVEGIIQKNIETRVQKSFIQGSEILKPAPKIKKELCHIDWNDSSRSICNLIRGLSPYPTAFTEIRKEDAEPVQLKIFSAEVSDMKIPVGTLSTDGKTYINVGTADGSVSLKEIQLAGKKRMDVRTFLLGFRDAGSYVTTQGSSKAEIEKTKSC